MKIKTDDGYSMFEEDEDNYFVDGTSTVEIDNFEKEASVEFQQNIQNNKDSHIEDLNYLTELIKEFQSYVNYDDSTLRHILLDCNMDTLAKSQGIRQEDIILSYNLEDVKYMKLIGDLYQELSKYLSEIPLKLKAVDRNIMLELLGTALSQSIWGSIKAIAKEQNSDAKQIRTLSSQLCGGAYYYKKFGASQFVDEATDDSTDIFLVVKSGLKVLKALIGNIKDNEVETDIHLVKNKIEDKTFYIRQLQARKFTPVTNETEVAGKVKIHDTMIGLIKMFYTAVPMSSMGYLDKVYLINEIILEEHDFNPKSVNIWEPKVYSCDEDLMFRTFIKEDAISFTILVKLPVGLDNFDFDKGKYAELDGLSMLFSNMNATKGDVYSSSLMKKPRICNLGKTRHIDCAYNCIEIVLSKDLLKFKNSSWSLRDYIKACKGNQNAFSTFDDLSLGEKIVVGAMPGALKAERFDCTGKYNVSGIVSGGAGSGKTAIFDSLLVQALGLKGIEGNGSVILVDPKQEWISPWANVFKTLGIPFYGFDGTVLDASEIKWKVAKRGKDEVENIPFTVTACVGGILFLRVIYETIQVILKETGCSDILEFNSKNVNYKGITKLPRTMILVDEMNTLHANLNDKAYPKSIYAGLILARLTRTSGFLWQLGGQDVNKTILSSGERSNYGYNIFGKMAEDRYEYFNVVQNQAVINYEAKNGTMDNPNPILSQGVFYAGQQGKTDLVKCLFVPKDERLDAVKDLGSDLDGMVELDNIVKLALKEGYFETLEVTLKIPNNIIYATLKHLGIITQQEFNSLSDRILNGTRESDESMNNILAGPKINVNLSDVDSNNNSTDSIKNNAVKEDNFDNYTSSQSTAPKSSSNDASKQTYKQTSNSNVQEDTYIPPKNRSDYVDVYNKPLKVKPNPFKIYGTSGNVSCLTSIRHMSSILLNEIINVFGDLSRIESVEITGDGLVINNIAFKPCLDIDIIDSLPFDIRNKVANGNIVDLLHFEILLKFKNLAVLRVDNSRLAEGRMRRELYIAPKKPWNVLFKKLRNLQELYIAGTRITDEATAKAYDLGGRGGFELTEKLRTKLEVPLRTVSSAPLERIWNSKPVKIATGALGWTLGVKAMMLATIAFGPWGLLASSLAVAGTLKNNSKNSKR